MTNTNDLYWAIDGVSLETWAWNIETLAGRMSPPELRGEDLLIPYVPGETWVPKVAGSRVVTLAMWVVGSDENGGIPVDSNSRDQFDANWMALQNLLFTPGRQFNLTKRFRYNGATRSATAKGEYAGGMEPTMMGRRGARFTVDIKLADPYFYDDVQTNTVLATGHQDVTVPGQVRSHNIELTIDGPRNVLEFTNHTNDQVMTVEKAVTSTQLVTVDVRNWAATLTPDGGGALPFAGFISHVGEPFWFGVNPGVNDIEMIESTSPSLGVVTLKVRGAWL